MAFKKSSDGNGFSIFETECAQQSSGLICDHIRRYYHSVAGEPPIFISVNADHLPGAEIIVTPSATLEEIEAGAENDECHREIRNLSEKALKREMKKRAWSEWIICAEGGHRPLNEEDVIQMSGANYVPPSPGLP